jgi:hypothetical protein
VLGTVGYTVSLSGAETLAATVFPIRQSTMLCPQTSQPDKRFPVRALDFALHAVFALGNANVSVPPLVVTSNDHETSRRAARRRHGRPRIGQTQSFGAPHDRLAPSRIAIQAGDV